MNCLSELCISDEVSVAEVEAKLLSGPVPRPCCRASRSNSSLTAAFVLACSLKSFFLGIRPQAEPNSATSSKGKACCNILLANRSENIQLRSCHLFLRSSSKYSILNHLARKPRKTMPGKSNTARSHYNILQ